MTNLDLLFAVDSEKLSKFGTNFLKSKEGSDAISAGCPSSNGLRGKQNIF